MSAPYGKVTAVIPAAGTGYRLASLVPKQILELNGRPIVCYALDLYERLDSVDRVILVVHPYYFSFFEQLIREGNYAKVQKLVPGGATRWDSVYAGIVEADADTEIAVIHNAVCIFTPPRVVEGCIAAARRVGAAMACTPNTFSNVVRRGSQVDHFIDRSNTVEARDPQAFRLDELKRLHRLARREGKGPYINDAILFLNYGKEVQLVESPPENIKITTRLDLELARLMISIGRRGGARQAQRAVAV
ncbi:MAG: 2-C-methyl-D-erythritol 4-phosphate cytidylyltransferase [Candidatus Omnitrophica bacterium]|nr:2-C-methyl-D-erythritol 4-phosphate cytidylyltransferase [Candidatus Omnitrophota bacterium]